MSSCLSHQDNMQIDGRVGTALMKSLVDLPTVAFTFICSYLEPVWLWNLSQVCKKLQLALAFPNGNHIWYTALPPALWKKPEGFQQNLVLDAMRAAQFASMYTISIMQGAVFPLPPRIRVQLLGGKYQPIFDYKCEILGRLERHDRCFICLCTQSSAGGPVIVRRWGILFCRSCLKDYTIAKGDMARIYNYQDILDRATLTPYEVGTTKHYYLPELNNILRARFDGLPVQTLLLLAKKHSFTVEKERVQRSALEGRRRLVRAKIVLFAQKIWDGYDPIAKEVVDEHSGEVTLIPRLGFSPTQYETFRKRFAPTCKLGTFLFPAYLLAEPSALLMEEYDSSSGWLPDPTKEDMERADTVDMIADDTISKWAERMLWCLTSVAHPFYHRKGMGGYVDKWTNAVKQYHISRLEMEIKSVVTVKISHACVQFHADRTYERLRDLRAKCHLQAPGAILMPQLPTRPERGLAGVRYSTSEFMHLDQAAARAEANRAEGIKFFNKIIRSCCIACPVTSPSTVPNLGLEGLVEHVRTGHRQLFWHSDEFHVVG